MRNLKKILAMVLALVMSLSLMATAGAADFPDVKEDTSFKTAIDVLSGLGVFNGYKEDGTFRPDGEITRAETAAIIYRIVTGDVKDEQVKIYSDYGLFKDVPANSWFAGYVNFCANAEYIKGDGKGNFNPNDKVEGYAALAMILRAIGYTANGGFTGSDWRVQTARVGEARKITKNITSGTLGSNADRKTVAEILYQAIMVDMVDHNVDNTFNGDQGYTTVPLTLGQKTFGLEYVSGVILANEWANLVGDEVLAADTTKMQITNTYATQSKIAKDATLTLNDKTELEMQEALDAVGLTYNAHIANPTATTADVITLDKSDINVVAYNEGKGVYKAAEHNNYNNATWATIEKLAEEEGLKLGTGAETEYFVNYEERWDANCTSDYRISYAIAKDSLLTGSGLPSVQDKTAWQNYIDELKTLTNNGAIPTPASSKYAGHYLGERTIKLDLNLDGTAETSVECWVVAIIPEATINQIDLDIMREIFYTADRVGNNGGTADWLRNYAVGEVYVGTTSMQDYSDTMSWKEFCDKYFVDDVNSRRFEQCEIGNSLRVIDNNGDGVAEYVLRIDYTQDKIVGAFKSQPAGYSVSIGNFEGNLLYNPDADKIEQGTVINYVKIDKKLYVWPAPVVSNESVTNKNFQKITVTVADEVYNQSGIENQTRLDDNIMLMAQNTKYNMYMDVYGNNIRSYELAQGSKYALLTEMYPTTDKNGNFVYNYGAIAEVKIGEADVTEYPVTVGQNGLNTFFNPSIWTWGIRNYFGVNANIGAGTTPSAQILNPNYLQPAVAHLGIGNVFDRSGAVVSGAVEIGTTNNTEAYKDVDWFRAVADVQPYSLPIANGIGGLYGIFDYDQARVGGDYTINRSTDRTVNTDAKFSYTNVASYVDNDGTLTLGTASKLAADRTTGAQIYRVGEDAANAAGCNIPVYTHGTEAYLKSEYVRLGAAGTTDTDANNWFATYIGYDPANNNAPTGLYRQGNGIYPVYAEDYVQLDLSKADMGQALGADDLVVKPGIRHFHIDDNYDVLYNANSNSYVDATIDTEFYIVIPGNQSSILYRVGYDNLPNIMVKDIRAAYAVAHNTRADSDGQDYWVADVIVIETSKETLNYDSISLVYYNPYEQNDYTRYADTLNNEWRTLQPDYENKAMMGITPKRGFAQNGWGNSSWSTINNESNYGFWKLYRTELTQPGQLSVGDVEKIIKDYNKYGIYAGVATRIEDLQTSAYIDVNVQKTGCVQTHAIDVDYGESTEVPFYRINSTGNVTGTIYTAEQINANRTLNLSDVKDGDELIWVYNKDQNRIAFVVDLGGRNKADGDSINYTAPAWLTTLYNAILVDENSGTAGAFDIADLLKRAGELDAKLNPTLTELTSMIKELEAAGDKTMTPAQAQDLIRLGNSLKGKALPMLQTAAQVAAQDKANEVLLNANVGDLTNTTDVSGKLSALKAAITAGGMTYDALEAIYKDGKLVDTQSDVRALNTAVDLALAKINAIQVGKKAITDAGLTTADVTTEWTAFTTAINACTGITKPAGTALTTTEVEFYVKDGKLVKDDTDTTVSDLLDEIEDVAGSAAVTAAVNAAKAKADSLVPAGYAGLGDVDAKLTALKDLLVPALGLDTLNAIANGTWTADAAVYTAYSELDAAIKAVAADAEANKEFDDAVKPDQGGISGGNNATPAPGGSSYGDAYNAFGVNVSYTSDGVSITVDRTKMAAVMTNPALYTPNITTMVDQGTLANIGNSSSAVIPLFVGAHFDVPVEAKSMKRAFVEGTPSDDPATLVSSKTAVARTADLSGDFNPSGMNNWYQIGTVKATKDASGNVTFSEVTVVQTPVEYMYVQFFTSNDGTADSEIGSILRFVGSVQFVG